MVASCGGQPPNPVSIYQPGDEERSCDGLKYEISENEDQIARMLPDQNATGKNVVLGITGALILVPLFFMDLEDSERIEIEALRRRNVWLREIARRKDCDLPPPTERFEKKPPVAGGPNSTPKSQ